MPLDDIQLKTGPKLVLVTYTYIAIVTDLRTSKAPLLGIVMYEWALPPKT